MGALSTYIGQVQDVLHDTAARFWTTQQLTNYINDARTRVASDTKCLRTVVTGFTLVAGQELYNVSNLSTLPSYPVGSTVVAVLGVTVYWGNLRIKLRDWSFTRLDAQTRYMQNYQDVPVGFARMGATAFYTSPIPNINYTADVEVSISPPPLTSDSSPEPIPTPFQEPIRYYASYLAKLNEQTYGESDMYFKVYRRQLQIANSAYLPRVIPSAYGS